MSSSDVAVSVRGLSKSYSIAHNVESHITLGETLLQRLKNPFKKPEIETFWALKDIDFDVQKGDVVGIIGRNGAGKSTLLKILSRITEPTAGYIDLYGRVGSLLEVGTGFHPELTGRENIYLNGAILGMQRREIDKHFDAIVDFSGVEQFLDTPVKRYSSGMYVRLAFAVAAQLTPEILIVDEVLAVGDAAFQKKCLGKMKDVAGSGRTVLFVSHNMGAVRGLCKSAIWLKHGTVFDMGNSDRIADAYMRASADDIKYSSDLNSIPRQGQYGEQCRLRAIEFNNGSPIVHGEPLVVDMDYEAFSPVQGVAIGFGFSNMDGVRLFSVDSDLQDDQRDLDEPHVGRIRARIDTLYLQPGRYSVDIGIRSGDNNGVDYLPACFFIDVLPGPSTPSTIIRDTGGVRMPAEWRWNRETHALPAKWR